MESSLINMRGKNSSHKLFCHLKSRKCKFLKWLLKQIYFWLLLSLSYAKAQKTKCARKQRNQKNKAKIVQNAKCLLARRLQAISILILSAIDSIKQLLKAAEAATKFKNRIACKVSATTTISGNKVCEYSASSCYPIPTPLLPSFSRFDLFYCIAFAIGHFSLLPRGVFTFFTIFSLSPHYICSAHSIAFGAIMKLFAF